MKTFKEIQKILAAEFNLPLKEVEAHTGSYWSDVRKRLNHPDTDVIRIVGLGSWQITPGRLFRLMAKYLIDLRRIRLGLIPARTVPAVEGEAREQFKKLWLYRQRMGWINTSRKAAPRELVHTRYSNVRPNPQPDPAAVDR